MDENFPNVEKKLPQIIIDFGKMKSKVTKKLKLWLIKATEGQKSFILNKKGHDKKALDQEAFEKRASFFIIDLVNAPKLSIGRFVKIYVL